MRSFQGEGGDLQSAPSYTLIYKSDFDFVFTVDMVSHYI
jgi:hypothetical protein